MGGGKKKLKNFQRPRLVKLLKAVALLLERSPLTGVEIMRGIGEISPGDRHLGASQKRAFERLKEDLLSLGVSLEKASCVDGPNAEETIGTIYNISRRRYVFRDPGLDDEEQMALNLLRQVIARDESFPLRPQLAQAFHKIAALRPMKEPTTAMAAAPDLAEPTHDPSVLDRLVAASFRNQVVRFEYLTFHSNTKRMRVVEPYGFFTRKGSGTLSAGTRISRRFVSFAWGGLPRRRGSRSA